MCGNQLWDIWTERILALYATDEKHKKSQTTQTSYVKCPWSSGKQLGKQTILEKTLEWTNISVADLFELHFLIETTIQLFFAISAASVEQALIMLAFEIHNLCLTVYWVIKLSVIALFR